MVPTVKSSGSSFGPRSSEPSGAGWNSSRVCTAEPRDDCSLTSRPCTYAVSTPEARNHLYLARLYLFQSLYLRPVRRPSIYLDSLHLLRPTMHPRTRGHCQWRQARRCMEGSRPHPLGLEIQVQAMQAGAHDCFHPPPGDSVPGQAGRISVSLLDP
jgi:hypothetical protein